MMRKILFILSMIPVVVMGQDSNQNYTKVTTYRGASLGNPQIQVSYFDGLGRPIQQVAHQQSNSGKDIVTHIEYDVYGRQVKEFLPYVNQTPSLGYNSSAATDVLTFYNATLYENTQNPYSEKLLEASPLNRIFKQAAPGNDWSLGSGHEIKMEYQTNIENEVVQYKAVAIWNASSGLYDISLNNPGNYAPNQLYKTITKDENWTSGNNNTTEEFKDKEGRVVLKKTYNNGDAHETYYVYDQFGNLTYVIPPLANDPVNQLDELCYQYKYDSRNRLVEKKLPGKQWEFIVYDRLDRVVATGPALAPFKDDNNIGWMITKYDVFGRAVYTGWYSGHYVNQQYRKIMQDIYNNPSTLINEQKATSGAIDNVPVYYTNTVFPTSGFYLLTANYYDNYVFPNPPSPIPSTVENNYYPVSTEVKGLATGSWIRVLTSGSEFNGEASYTLYDTKSRPVRSYTKNYLGGYTQVDTNLDFSGKTLYTVTKHKRLTGDVETSIKDNFTYTAQDRLVEHTQEIGTHVELIARNTYNELGQLISKNVGDLPSASVALQKIDYSYNIRGWLKSINDTSNLTPSITENDLFGFKINYNNPTTATALYNGNISETLWKTSSDNVLRKYSYSYDNLNRLLEANYSKPDNASAPNNYLELLTYDKNGNIQSLLRNGDRDSDGLVGENNIDDLVYFYDTQFKNRLLKVYDQSGSPQGFNEIADDNAGDLDYGNNLDLTDDYEYDLNGNMVRDDNKGISSIAYNHLNLPLVISFASGETIEYIYNAIGQKVQKTVHENSLSLGYVPPVTDYLNGFQYKNGVLLFFSHAEGYVNNTVLNGSNNFNYVYNYTDHLGNVRLSYGLDPSTQVLKIIEQNHYFPFGLKHTNYNSDQLIYQKGDTGSIVLGRPGGGTAPKPIEYKYKMQNKELQDELGLNVYDYGMMMYDPALGRRNNLDQLAEKMRRYSPYSFCFNNPMRFTDPDGMSPQDIIVRGSQGYQNRVLRDMQKLTNDKLVLVGGQVKIASTGTENKDKNLTMGSSVISSLIEKPQVTEIRATTGQNTTTPNDLTASGNSKAFGTAEKPGAGAGSTIEYNPNDKGEHIVNDDENCSTGRPSEMGIGHELPHALSNANGTSDQTKDPTTVDPDSGQKGVLSNEEISVRKVDNIIRKEQGITPRAMPN